MPVDAPASKNDSKSDDSKSDDSKSVEARDAANEPRESGAGPAASEQAPELAPARRGPPAFGTKGQVIVNVDRLLPLFGYTSQSVTAETGDATVTTTDTGVSLALLVGSEPSLSAIHTVPRIAADYVVAPRLTVGTAFVAALGIAGAHVEERAPRSGIATVRESDATTPTLLGFAPRVGYVLSLPWMHGRFAFWPRAGFAFYSLSASRAATSNTGVTSTATVTDTVFSIDLDPQLVFVPLPHVFVHGGVLANIPLAGSHETSFEQANIEKDRSDDLTVFHLGVSLGAGVWFDL